MQDARDLQQREPSNTILADRLFESAFPRRAPVAVDEFSTGVWGAGRTSNAARTAPAVCANREKWPDTRET